MMSTSSSALSFSEILALRDRATRHARELALAEGARFVLAALSAKVNIHTFIRCRELGLPSIVHRRIRQHGAPIIDVDVAAFRNLSLLDEPSGIAFAFHPKSFRLPRRPRRAQTWLAFDEIRSPGNFGTLIRTLAAFEGSGVLLLSSAADPYDPRSVRATMGAIFSQPVVRLSPREFREWTRRNRVMVVGTSAHAQADFRKVDYRRPTVFMIGCERRGMSSLQKSLCHRHVRIDMPGPVSSLNVAMAAGLCVFEAHRQRAPVRRTRRTRRSKK